jgi:hypothetical protein
MVFRHPLISADALAFLKKAIGENKTIVEVGCYAGGTTSVLAETNKVIAIDPLIPKYDPSDAGLDDMDGVEEALLETIKGKNIIWYKEKSGDVLKWWKDEIDGVLIDGNHSEAFVLIDLGWIPFVRKGGIIAFHDYNFWPSVHGIVDQYVKGKYEEIGIVGDLIIFRK